MKMHAYLLPIFLSLTTLSSSSLSFASSNQYQKPCKYNTKETPIVFFDLESFISTILNKMPILKYFERKLSIQIPNKIKRSICEFYQDQIVYRVVQVNEKDLKAAAQFYEICTNDQSEKIGYLRSVKISKDTKIVNANLRDWHEIKHDGMGTFTKKPCIACENNLKLLEKTLEKRKKRIKRKKTHLNVRTSVPVDYSRSCVKNSFFHRA